MKPLAKLMLTRLAFLIVSYLFRINVHLQIEHRCFRKTLKFKFSALRRGLLEARRGSKLYFYDKSGSHRIVHIFDKKSLESILF